MTIFKSSLKIPMYIGTPCILSTPYLELISTSNKWCGAREIFMTRTLSISIQFKQANFSITFLKNRFQFSTAFKGYIGYNATHKGETSVSSLVGNPVGNPVF